MNIQPLIELTRGDTTECLHLGAISVVNARGEILSSVGNPHLVSFSRSTLKVFQALPFVLKGGPAHFGFTSEELALLCASHNGEDYHVRTIQSILEKIGLGVFALRCGCHVPGIFSYMDKHPPVGLTYDERHNNCSGKHAGFLAYCIHNKLPTDDYLGLYHPLQLSIRQQVSEVCGVEFNDLNVGIDGCSAPNYALPLSRLAFGYARLSSGINDPVFGESFHLLRSAMMKHPTLISGTGRSDLAFTLAGRGDWISKVGADGVQVIASISRQEAFAIKIIDGNKPALFSTTVEVLDQLGWMDEVQKESLSAWRSREIVNAGGVIVGNRRPIFKLSGQGKFA